MRRQFGRLSGRQSGWAGKCVVVVTVGVGLGLVDVVIVLFLVRIRLKDRLLVLRDRLRDPEVVQLASTESLRGCVTRSSPASISMRKKGVRSNEPD